MSKKTKGPVGFWGRVQMVSINSPKHCVPLESRHSMVLGFKWETQGEPFTAGQTPLSQLHLLRRQNDVLFSSPFITPCTIYCSIAHPFFHVDPTVPDGWNCLSLWLDQLQNQDVSDDILSRGTKCIEADVKALHLESCSAGWQRHMAACSMCQHLGSLSTTFSPSFHPLSIKWTN